MLAANTRLQDLFQLLFKPEAPAYAPLAGLTRAQPSVYLQNVSGVGVMGKYLAFYMQLANVLAQARGKSDPLCLGASFLLTFFSDSLKIFVNYGNRQGMRCLAELQALTEEHLQEDTARLCEQKKDQGVLDNLISQVPRYPLRVQL